MKETKDVENNPRLKRIDRLFDELRYEIEIGMMQGEIDEILEYGFIVPQSKIISGGVVMCKFVSKPVRHCYDFDSKPIGRLRLVKDEQE